MMRSLFGLCSLQHHADNLPTTFRDEVTVQGGTGRQGCRGVQDGPPPGPGGNTRQQGMLPGIFLVCSVARLGPLWTELYNDRFTSCGLAS